MAITMSESSTGFEYNIPRMPVGEILQDFIVAYIAYRNAGEDNDLEYANLLNAGNAYLREAATPQELAPNDGENLEDMPAEPAPRGQRQQEEED